MKMIEEVLDGLEHCNKQGVCKECPYFGSGEFGEMCMAKVRSDAIALIRKLQDENRALRTELTVNSGDYWRNICKLNSRQEAKGMDKYGEPLEQNTTLTTTQRIEHLQEEMIDALKYCEHLKQVIDADGITANDYQRAAMRTDNKDQTAEERMLDALFGLCGEAGEVMDAYKKYRFQGHETYKDEMIIECSDLLWYAAKLADVLGVTLGEVMERNIEKLKKRFPDGFDKARSINRKENAE